MEMKVTFLSAGLAGVTLSTIFNKCVKIVILKSIDRIGFDASS